MTNIQTVAYLFTILASIATVGGLFWQVARNTRIDIFLDTKGDEVQRQKKLRELKRGGHDYYSQLDRALVFCDEKIDPKWALKSLGFCYVLALFYSLFGLLIPWVFGGLGVIGNTTFLGPLEIAERLAFFGTFTILSIAVVYLIVYSVEIQRYLEEKYSKGFVLCAACISVLFVFSVPPFLAFEGGVKFYQSYLIVALSVPFVATILVGHSSVGLVPVLVGISLFSSGFAYTPMFFGGALPVSIALFASVGFLAAVLVGLLKGDTARAVGITGAIGAAFVGYLGASAGDFQNAFANPSTVAIIFFLVLLPFINGIVDWVSLSLSRWFGEVLRDKAPAHGASFWNKAWIPALVLIDLVVAYIFMVAIIISLTFIVEIYNISANEVINESPLDLKVLIEFLKSSDNFTDFIWLWLLVFSTLVPTVAHFIFVLFASFFVPHPRQSKLDAIERNVNSDVNLEMLQGCRAMAHQLTVIRMTRIVLGFGLFLLVTAVVIYLIQETLHTTVFDHVTWIVLRVVDMLHAV